MSYASPFLQMLISQGFAVHKKLSEESPKAIRMPRRAACPAQSASKRCGPGKSGVAGLTLVKLLHVIFCSADKARGNGHGLAAKNSTLRGPLGTLTGSPLRNRGKAGENRIPPLVLPRVYLSQSLPNGHSDRYLFPISLNEDLVVGTTLGQGLLNFLDAFYRRAVD